MPPKAESSTTYRDRPVDNDDDDDDDLDDLDDVLASFNKPSPSTSANTVRPGPAKPTPLPPQPLSDRKATVSEEDGEEDFEASLVEGMESLLRQLAGDNPPGPMPGSTSTGSTATSGVGARATASAKERGGAAAASARGAGGQADPMSPEDEEKAFQRAIEMMLSKEGLDALGLDDPDIDLDSDKPSTSTSTSTAAKDSKPRGEAGSPSSSSTKGPESTQAKAKAKGPDPASFEETIRKAMESLGGDKQTDAPGMGNGGIPSDPADLAKLLAQLGNDPNLDLEGDDELSGILDGMMGQLMTREVLEEPMAELASKYPDYLASPPANTPPADLEKYRQQHAIVQQIVDTFRKAGYSDDKDGKEVARLVGEMQDLGGPPQEIMGDLPEGFDLGALAGGDESCTIM